MKKILLKILAVISYFLFNPIEKLYAIRAIPHYIKNVFIYKSKSVSNINFSFSLKDIYVTTADKFASAGTAKGHYFFQDIWAAQQIFKRNVEHHVDVGSRIDGFVAHVLSFCKVTYVDIRPMESTISKLIFVEGSITNLPFDTNSINSLSCLHVLEHIGLGRYGDTIDTEGYIKSANELVRVLKPGGHLYFGTPVGRERLCFDAHRIFDPQTILAIFKDLTLLEFSLIDDKGNKIYENADISIAKRCDYGCGLFEFTKI